MTRAKFDELYGGRAVHCPTKALAKEFLKLADSAGYVWFGDKRSLLEKGEYQRYQRYGEYTYYRADSEQGFMSYGDVRGSAVFEEDILEFNMEELPKEARGDAFNESLKNALLSYAWDMKNVIIEEDYKGKKFIIYDRASMFDPKMLVDDDGYFTETIDKLEVLNVFINDLTLYIIVKEIA